MPITALFGHDDPVKKGISAKIQIKGQTRETPLPWSDNLASMFNPIHGRGISRNENGTVHKCECCAYLRERWPWCFQIIHLSTAFCENFFFLKRLQKRQKISCLWPFSTHLHLCLTFSYLLCFFFYSPSPSQCFFRPSSPSFLRTLLHSTRFSLLWIPSSCD